MNEKNNMNVIKLYNALEIARMGNRNDGINRTYSTPLKNHKNITTPKF